MISSLKLLPYRQYRGVRREYSVVFYYLPVFGRMYRRRVELCLAECKGGDSVLEVGFGSGLTFLNLNDLYKQIYGLDLSCDVAEVKQVFAPLGIRPDLRNGNVLEMPYPDNQFDTVLLISILEHLQPAELDRALDFLYGEDERSAGLGASSPKVASWLGDIRRYFPREVVAFMEKDAIERKGLRQLLMEPEVLQSLEKDVGLVATIMAFKHLMPEQTRQTARQVVAAIVGAAAETSSSG